MPKEAIEDGQAEWQNPAARVKQWRRLKEKQLAVECVKKRSIGLEELLQGHEARILLPKSRLVRPAYRHTWAKNIYLQLRYRI